MSVISPFKLDGKKFLITGAASGIGRTTSIILSKLGVKLILVDTNEKGLFQTQQECVEYSIGLLINLADTDSIKDKVLTVISKFGKIDGFIHLAGISYIAPLKSVSLQKTKEVFAINTHAALELAKVFSNRKVYSGEKGSIVLVSSVYGLVGSSANVSYAISKSALHGLTKSLSIELASKGIRVNCIAPGFVKTNMLDSASDLFDSNYAETLNKLHPLGVGEPEDIAYAIVYLLSDAAKWVTGTIISIDGGFTAQ